MPTAAFCFTSITGDSAVTVTLSVSVATASAKSIFNA